MIGKASGWLVRAQTLAGQEARKRDEESPIDSLFADILREETKADIALLPGVGYGVAIPPGAVTAAQLRQMVPHEGKVVTMRLSGTQVVEVLEQAVENMFTDDPQVKVGGMIQVWRHPVPVRPDAGEGAPGLARRAGRGRVGADGRVHRRHQLDAGRRRAQLPDAHEGREADRTRLAVRDDPRWFAKNSPVATPPAGRIAKAAMT